MAVDENRLTEMRVIAVGAQADLERTKTPSAYYQRELSKMVLELVTEVRTLRSKYEEWDSMHEACLALREDVARLSEHSVTLNTVSYNIAEALGKVTRPEDYAGDVEEDLAALIEQARGIFVHLGPEGTGAQFRCCGRFVQENLGQRMTYDESLVTCRG